MNSGKEENEDNKLTIMEHGRSRCLDVLDANEK